MKVRKILAALPKRAGKEQDQLYQLLSVTLQRENARAVRRLSSETIAVPHC